MIKRPIATYDRWQCATCHSCSDVSRPGDEVAFRDVLISMARSARVAGVAA